MPSTTKNFYGKGTRAVLAFSTLSPTLVLLGVKGIGDQVTLISESIFICIFVCIGIFGSIAIPWIMVFHFRRSGSDKVLERQSIEEATDHMLVYGLAVILPLWAGETESNNSLLATLLAFCLVWFLVASSNLHHANLWLRIFGYKFFIAGSGGGSESFLILSRSITSGNHDLLKCRIIDSKLLLHIDE